MQNVVPKLAFTGRRPPLHLDPPEHTPYRTALNPYFTAEKMRRLEPRLRAIIGGLLEPLVGAGEVDICEAYTYRLPGYVFAEFFNLSPELGLRIRDASREFNVAVQDFVDEEVKRTSLQLYDIAREIIAMRKAEPLDPADDPTAGLLATGLPEDMLLGTIRQFIVVGMIAPSVFIGAMVIHLAEHEDVQQQLRADPSLIPAAVDEYLRLLTPYRGFARTPTRDVVVRGRLIPKDEPVAVVFASANRDEDVFPDPDRFILHRPEHPPPPRLRPRPAPLRRRAAGDAHAAPHARGAPRPDLAHRRHGRADDDALARVGHACPCRCALQPDFDPFAPDFVESPHATWARLRRERPVARGARWDFWALTRYDDVKAVSANYGTFTSEHGIVVPSNPVSGRRAPLHFDPPEHPRYRRPLNAALAEERVRNARADDPHVRGRAAGADARPRSGRRRRRGSPRR